MKYDLAIFDMDGTILNTLTDLKNSLNYSLSACGYNTRSLSEVRRFVGNGIRKLVERGVPQNTDSYNTSKVFEIFNKHYAVHCTDTTKPYDGVIDVLAKLKEKGMKTAVVSNKSDYAVQSLCEQFFSGLFDCKIGVKDGINKKPCPDSVNLVLKQLNTEKERAVYIGDSEVDIATAENAKVDCISVDWGFRSHEELLDNNAKNIISSTDDLLKIILE